ncbi:hypothetical protein EII29_00540 [Leptotrichia sp. OH3620_COT-345]|uniref:hypothetical protein n=1 Tax=Leptotrichia sp. OH3620_COT-345 TaxID=2491048 RepID=UPI000F6517DA|nr:hypothetical protein [Leptotrichia sp. OH3620_COT-345]RRD40974.1 hypothetical protein EII29_00540 [Leptotrichia sp. OH3620_COT-345]
MDNLIKFLQNNITDKMSIEGIVNVFEKMCSISVDSEEDLILFETGIFSYNNESLFQISLVRQLPNDVGEYYQIHVDIFYPVTSENKIFKEVIWDEDLNENIFNYVRNSKVFSYVKNKEYLRVEIYIDET